MHHIKPSATLVLANKARELKAKGVDILDLSLGEPDFDTFDNIKHAAIEAIKSGKTKYTDVSGIRELKEAIRKSYSQRATFSLDNIIVSSGAKQAIYNALMVTINEGDEVIIPAPYWVSYPDMVRVARGNPVIVECTDSSNFKITPSLLERAITNKTKWVFLNSPNNPTGMKYSRDELVSLVKVIEDNPNIYVLSDDIYEVLSYEDHAYSLIDYADSIKDRLLVVNGVSKSYAMTGWRIGYAIGPIEIIKAMSVMQSQSTSNPCSISQYAALEALTGTQEYMNEGVLQFKKKRDLAHDLLNNLCKMECKKSDGAFYLFPKCTSFFGLKTEEGEVITNDHDFCKYLLEEARVVVVPGSAFGAEGYFRLSYATSERIIEEAAKRISLAIVKLR